MYQSCCNRKRNTPGYKKINNDFIIKGTAIFHILLITSAFLCSLVAGFLFAFAAVVMPGIKNLNDKNFLRAFQVMDRIIQNNQPLFMIVWPGSIVVLIVTVVYGFTYLDGTNILLLHVAAFIYLIGVQLPTIIFNIPLNNKLQTLNLDSLNPDDLKSAREEFEPRWNRWNKIRTSLSGLSTFLLLILLFVI